MAGPMEFSNRTISIIEQPSPSEPLAVLYLSCANANLLSNNDRSALQDYQKALEALGDFGDRSLEFLISYGMIVACDRLQIRDLCEDHLFRLRALINDLNQQEDSLEENPLPEKISDEIPNYLRALAATAPSVEIRSALQSLVSEIFIGSYSHSAYRGNPAYKPFLAKPCKSFWQKLEKLAHNIRRACEKVLDIIERSLDIWDRVEGKLKDKNDSDNKALA